MLSRQDCSWFLSALTQLYPRTLNRPQAHPIRHSSSSWCSCTLPASDPFIYLIAGFAEHLAGAQLGRFDCLSAGFPKKRCSIYFSEGQWKVMDRGPKRIPCSKATFILGLERENMSGVRCADIGISVCLFF